jgi:hypothetical protein
VHDGAPPVAGGSTSYLSGIGAQGQLPIMNDFSHRYECPSLIYVSFARNIAAKPEQQHPARELRVSPFMPF